MLAIRDESNTESQYYCLHDLTYPDVVRQEGGTGQRSDNSSEQVDDTDPQPANQLLKVLHHCRLEDDGQEQIKRPAVYISPDASQ